MKSPSKSLPMQKLWIGSALISSLAWLGATQTIVSAGPITTAKPSESYLKANAALNEAREAFKAKKYDRVEALLTPLLPEVRKNEAGKAILGRYLGVLAATAYFEKKYKESVAYATEALHVDHTLMANEAVSDSAIFANHSYAAMSLRELEKLPDAIEHYQSAILYAERAPRQNINQDWLKLCYEQLGSCLRRQGKYEEARKVKERMLKAGFN